MERRDLLQRFLEIQFWLLRLLAQHFDRPTRLLAEEREELVEELVLGHTRHTFESALFWFRFRVLHRSIRGATHLKNEIRRLTTRLLNDVPDPTPTPLLSILIPPLPPLIPASSILPICLCGVLYFLVLSFICFIYAAFKTGRRLQLCLTRPACTVVRARGLCGSLLFGSTIFGRSATTIWFSTLSLTISNSYTSGWISFGLVLYAEFGPNWGRVESEGSEGLGGRKSMIRGVLPDEFLASL